MSVAGRALRVAVVTSHPIQYQAPWFRGLARECELQVFFAHRQTASQQAEAGFGVAFDWDVDLTSGYPHAFLHNVARVPGVFAFGGCDTPEIHSRLSDGRFDAVIVTGWYLKSFVQTVLAARRLRIPALVRGDSWLGTPRSWIVRALKQPAYRAGLRTFSAFLSVGRRHSEYLKHYAVPESHIFFAPHFADGEHFRAPFEPGSTQRAAARAAIGVKDDAPLALFVGRFVDLKRPLDAVRAAGALARGGKQVQLAFAGDGPLAEAIRREAHEQGACVHLLGFRNQQALPPIYAAADALVMPSAHESWGLVVNEAMSCGLPAVVSQNIGCVPDLIDEGVTGFTHPVGDVPRLADALARAFELRARPATAAALEAKMQRYSCRSAVDGSMAALEAVTR